MDSNSTWTLESAARREVEKNLDQMIFTLYFQVGDIDSARVIIEKYRESYPPMYEEYKRFYDIYSSKLGRKLVKLDE